MVEGKKKEPRLWIERMVIYADTDSASIIRDINLKRGLNIVWGVAQDQVSDEERPGMLTGHSVGKTSFCRLLRYCLGEESFGRPAAVEGIRHTFPKGAVGMTLHIDGEKWSVLRSFFDTENSKSAKGMTIEDLLPATKDECPLFSFQNKLKKRFIDPLPASKPPYSEAPFEWAHLLAWLTRDQEARYRNLHEWREARSASRSPSFKKPKQDALYLMRMVLGLVDAEEVTLTNELDKLKQKESSLSAQIKEEKEQPERHLQYLDERLRNMFADQQALMGDDGELFGLETFIANQRNALQEGAERDAKEYRQLSESLVSFRSLKKNHEDELKRLAAAIDTTRLGTEEKSEIDEELQQLNTVREDECTFGNIDFSRCEYFTQHLAELKREYIDFQKEQQDRRARAVTGERQKTLQEWLEEKTGLQQALASLRGTIQALERKQADLERSILTQRSKLETLEQLSGQRKKLIDLLNGKTENTRLGELENEVKDVKGKIKVADEKLKNLQGRLYQTGVALRETYNQLLERVLSSAKHSGHIDLPPEKDLDFRINEATVGLTGEAVETLALVLADIASMLWTVQGNGHHPCFLLHDSPREADLDGFIYGRYLRGLHKLSKELGDSEAPFQYIVTTTSKPPESLIQDDTVRLTLKADVEQEMLFRTILRRVSLLGVQDEKENVDKGK